MSDLPTTISMAIVAGPDQNGIVDALEAEGVTVEHLKGIVTRPVLEEAGIVDADLYVLTDAGQATTISIAHDLTDDLRTVTYTRETIPEFAKGQLDFVIDPAIVDVTMFAEELSSPQE